MNRRSHSCPLEGKSLAIIILLLVDEYGWKELSDLTKIATFQKFPNFATNINYLKKTPSARKKVEA
ncbi:MAG: VF530 family DNA-binding protein, partial [Flavobacteriales bacterium]|nr:VF530 family DNA-binding protein [Flavobacteriales bacterium]